MKLKPSEQESLEVAAKLFKAIEQGSVAAVRNLYAPQIKIWHNFDGATQTIEENLALLEWMVGNIAEIAYTDIKRQPTPTGFVQHTCCTERRSRRAKKLQSRDAWWGSSRAARSRGSTNIWIALKSLRCAASLGSQRMRGSYKRSARSSCDD